MQTTSYSAMYTPGTLLRLAREERKLSLSDVKLVCKIRESALHAMETDQYERFPNSYMNTFLPEYATFLGIPASVLSESFAKHFPEREDLRTHFRTHALRQIANEQAFATHVSFAEQSRAFVRNNARKGFAVALAGVLAWFMFSLGEGALQSGKMHAPKGNVGMGELHKAGASAEERGAEKQGFWKSLLAKVIVSTPEDMRGTPFTEVSAVNPVETHTASVSQVNRTKSHTLNDIARLAVEKNEVLRREEEMQQNNASMRVISLAAIVPMQRELQHALEQGFETMSETLLHDEKADARMRRQTSLASVSLTAAKARLELDAKHIRDKNSLGSSEGKSEEQSEEKGMFFAADMDNEDEGNGAEAESSASSANAGVIGNTRLEDLRTNADAMRARIALIMQTRRFSSASSSGVGAETQREAAWANARTSFQRGAISRVEFVELQTLTAQQQATLHVHQPQAPSHFEPIHLPQNWAQGQGSEIGGASDGAENLAQN